MAEQTRRRRESMGAEREEKKQEGQLDGRVISELQSPLKGANTQKLLF